MKAIFRNNTPIALAVIICEFTLTYYEVRIRGHMTDISITIIALAFFSASYMAVRDVLKAILWTMVWTVVTIIISVLIIVGTLGIGSPAV